MKQRMMPFAGMMLFLAGCASPVPPADSFPEEGRGERIVGAIVAADYHAFAEAAGETDNVPDAEAFTASCRSLTEKCGKAASFRYLGSLETPMLVNQLWAVRFVRKGDGGKAVAREQLLQLIFGRDEHKVRLLGMRFI